MSYNDAFRSAQNNSIVALVAAWSPVVEAILSFIAAQVSDVDFASRIAEEEDVVDNVARPVASLLYASRNNLSFESFSQMVSDS